MAAIAAAAAVAAPLPQHASDGRRRRFRRRATDPRCCAELAEACPPSGPCCTALTTPAERDCARRTTPLECSRAYPEPGEPASEYCVWLGGHCTLGSSSDCREAYNAAATSYYGEASGFEAECASGGCPAFAAALKRYAAAHEQATAGAEPFEGMSDARLLVINDHWRNVGMGFMPTHVANTMVLALATGMYVYFENYGRYDWSRYFFGHGGLDLRWTPAKRRLWSARFGAAGVRKHVVRVLVEEGPLRGSGEDEWEEHLTAALANHSIRWVQLDGQATTFNWGRVLRPAVPPARAARLSRLPRWPPPLPMASTDPRGERLWRCVECAIWANFRPRRALRAALRGSPLALGAPLACLKARTMYAEDKRFFPDELPRTLAALDALWLGYSDKERLGDVTWWGPRERLRCAGTARGAERELLRPSAAIACMEKVRGALGGAARLFVAVDAPGLQQIVFNELGARAFITPGVGVDPTNEFRDHDYGKTRTKDYGKSKGRRRRGMYSTQQVAEQDLAEQNLVKVSLDYFIQGFCLSSMTLRPSAFYGAASLRTAAVRPAIARNISAATRSDPAARCLGGFDRTHRMGDCQRKVCGLTSCNLHQ